MKIIVDLTQNLVSDLLYYSANSLELHLSPCLILAKLG